MKTTPCGAETGGGDGLKRMDEERIGALAEGTISTCQVEMVTAQLVGGQADE